MAPAQTDYPRPDLQSVPHKLRVLLLTTSYPLNEQSVSGLFVQRLAEALAQQVDLRVLTPADVHAPRPPAGGPAVITFRYAPRTQQILAHGAGGIPAAIGANRANLMLVPPFLLSMLAASWRHARGADVIFANWSICGIVAGVVGRVRGIPVVVTLRGEDANRAHNGKLFRSILALCAHLCQGVVTVSEAMRHVLDRTIPALGPKLQTIPNGVAPEFLRIAPHSKPDGPLELLCVASLIPRKSVSTLVDALALTQRPHSLTIVGEGTERERLSMLVRDLGLQDRIRFLPFLPPARIVELLAAADAFVLPSLAEGRPNVVLEAFAAARPVIACDIDGVRELIGADERGLLYPPGNVATLAAQLDRLADPDLRARLGTAARRFIVDEGLTWDRAAASYARLFETLIRPSGPR
ncbi:glycosyltransferase [Aromatoleum toluclasticum]|uniref:glycosyltransferase n=1 Tax=Aromatoleum toluclasticum TaxID=92003 RepID=UPI001D182771|nr:glycosyltransferase [Aromatoleum toluclasticum]